VDPRTLRLIAVSAVAVVVLAACNDAEPSPSEGVAASVAGNDITDAQLAKQAQLFTFLAALNQQPCGGPAPAGETQDTVCNRFALTNTLQQTVVADFAEANDVTVTDKQVSDIVANLDQTLGADKVDEQLTKLKLTRDDLNELARQVLVFQGVQKKVIEQELDEDALRAQYDKDILQYTTVQAEHILVKTEAEAQDVYQQVTAPGFTDKDFLALAKQVSIDPGVKQNSGSLGSAVASTYLPEFGEAVAALEPGEISQPVQTDVGWHVIKLISKDVTPFEEAKAQMMQTQAPTVFSDWLRTQFDEGNLEVNPKYGRFDEETLTVVAIDSTDPSATASATASPGVPTPTVASPTP
jgi:parvulin-like peptidyl-prolyl isomerase